MVALATPATADKQHREPTLTSAVAAPATSEQSSQPDRATADPVPTLSEIAEPNRLLKVKAAPASPAATIVANTSMPATMAIAPASVAGTPALRAHLHSEAAKFELEEGAKPLSGTVRLRFLVGADGKLSNLQVVRGMRADYNKEALRMLCEGPAWRPGIAGGHRATLPMEVTVSF